ncbi:MAG: hypothetical protein GEU91_17805 [Rhizobiales bacterium]|nr:hypothetical protein [Hyphomicrobiales bacterium]
MRNQKPISFVVPSALHEAIERAADAEMISVSSYCRRAVLHEATGHGFVSPEKGTSECRPM